MAKLRRALVIAMMIWSAVMVPNFAEAGEIAYGYPEQPPRAFTNSEGLFDGYYAKLLAALFRRADMTWDATAYPATRLMAELRSGTVNFSILVRNPTLEDCCLYSEKPVWFDELRIYRRAGTRPVTKIDDLRGARLITLAGFSYGGLIKAIQDPANAIAAEPAIDHATAFAMLDAGRAPYLIDYGEPAETEGLVKHPMTDIAHDTLDTVRMWFVIHKSLPNAADTLRRLEGIYEAMRADDPQRQFTR